MKDAYYFPHDSNAKDDPKIMLLIDQLGLEGYGIFWVLIETLRDQNDFKCQLSLVPVLAKRYNTSTEKMNTVIKTYGLFQIDDDKFFFSQSLINRLNVMIDKKQRRIEAGKKAIAARWGKQYIPNTNVLPESYQRNDDVIRDDYEPIVLDYTKLDYTKLNNTKLNNTNNDDVIVVKSIMDYYSFNELNNFDKLRSISQFVFVLHSHSKLDQFISQFDAYKKFKEQSKQIKHGFKSFIGTIENNFEDGGWCAENWLAKLSDLTPQAEQSVSDNIIETSEKVLQKLKSEIV